MAGHSRNFVHIDEIWKDHVHRETQSFTYRWPEKWGYLTEEYRMLHRQLHGLPCPPAEFQTTDKEASFKLPPLSVAKPQHTGKLTAFPVTTAQQIGWRLRQPDMRPLEVYGRQARGHVGLLKRLNWPRQGL